ncbi:MAG TPA: J domain-containing protein [Kribbella sp.]|nr:J domain-containing protein [Kribbella sp.]
MTDQREPDLYEALGVPSGVTGAELDHAFRVLARRLHPDSGRDGGDGEAFQRVLAAYAVLRDPVARGKYDQRRADLKRKAETRRPPSPNLTVRTGRAGEPLIRVGPVRREFRDPGTTSGSSRV